MIFLEHHTASPRLKYSVIRCDMLVRGLEVVGSRGSVSCAMVFCKFDPTNVVN